MRLFKSHRHESQIAKKKPSLFSRLGHKMVENLHKVADKHVAQIKASKESTN
jgi:hypothetical protein